jgi:hypothetical protein
MYQVVIATNIHELEEKVSVELSKGFQKAGEITSISYDLEVNKELAEILHRAGQSTNLTVYAQPLSR